MLCGAGRLEGWEEFSMLLSMIWRLEMKLECLQLGNLDRASEGVGAVE